MKLSSSTVVSSNAYTYNKAHMRATETAVYDDFAEPTNGLVHYSNKTSGDKDQLASSTNPSLTYSYDDDGNMTKWYTPEGYEVTATYDAANRLASATYTGHSYTFYYDADGLLFRQVIDGVETRFVRDGYLVVQERDASNNVTNSYTWNPEAPGGIGGLLELKRGGSVYNYLFDGRGNVSEVIDYTQSVVASYKYNGFGESVGESGTLVQPYRFSTKRDYPGLGVVGYEYRYYLPGVGKWLTRDPIGEEGGLNIYKAMDNSLVNKRDLFGHGVMGDAWDWVEEIGGLVAESVGSTIGMAGCAALEIVGFATIPQTAENAAVTKKGKENINKYFKNVNINSDCGECHKIR